MDEAGLMTLIGPYINFVYSGPIRTLVAIVAYSSHRLIIGKVEIDSFCCLISGNI